MDEHVENVVTNVVDEIIDIVSSHLDVESVDLNDADFSITQTSSTNLLSTVTSQSEEKPAQSERVKNKPPVGEKRSFRPFICFWCDRRFPTYHQLKGHVGSHLRLPTCELCGNTFTRKSSLAVHMMSHTGDRPHKCQKCGKCFITKSALNKHVLTHSQLRPYSCDLCHKAFKTSKALGNHKTLRHPPIPKVVKCSSCEALFETKEALDKHKKEFHNTNPPKPPKTTESSPPKLIKCIICSTLLSNLEDRQKHMKEVHWNKILNKPRPPTVNPPPEPPVFKCLKCQAKFDSKALLKDHDKQAHPKPIDRKMNIFRDPDGKEKYQCDICDKIFTKKGNAREHIRRHSQPKFTCLKCGKAFLRKEVLDRHTAIHTGEHPFVCPHCNIPILSEESLKTHVATMHLGAASFKCDVCERQYRTKKSLNQHKKIHLPDRPNKCSTCGHGFISQNDLKRHERIHTGERPYSCAHCDKSFTHSATLRKHRNSKHPDVGNPVQDSNETAVQEILEWINSQSQIGEDSAEELIY